MDLNGFLNQLAAPIGRHTVANPPVYDIPGYEDRLMAHRYIKPLLIGT